ncbi:MAG TPA: signal peptidase II [Chthoniobacterales bacterium]|nr:signal peptidase II [Chthoniobacterales bacterium]
MRLILCLSIPLYVLDQWTKRLVLLHIKPDEPRIIVPDFFALVHVTNTGAAFGSFRNNNTFFLVLGCAALVLVCGLLITRKTSRPWRDVSLALLLAGILGNLTDRVLYGRVIDFLLFDLHVPFAHPWPAFNVADACICIAVVAFMIHSMRQPKIDAAAH